jgi:hypothetical protein
MGMIHGAGHSGHGDRMALKCFARVKGARSCGKLYIGETPAPIS